MRDFLLEIGTEELPPAVISPALQFLKGKLSGILKREDIETFGTPRRLAFYIRNFENRKEIKEETIFGPPWSVAFDEKGNPTKALEGFLRRYGAKPEDVFKERKKKGEYVAIKLIHEERSYLEILKDRFEEILLSVPLPKRMRWTSSRRISFSRPVRWIVALYGEEVVDLRFGNLRAGRRTQGHRFLSRGWIELQRAEDYLRVMKENYVIPSIEERKRIVLDGIREKAESVGAQVESSPDLIEEVTNLVEYPFPILGKFEERFLDLPDQVIVTVAAHHQRFFCLSKDGKLTNYFIGVSNNKPRTDLIRRGYEKVLRARLEDALFFYREDLKRKLEDLVPKLSGVLVHPKIGSMLEKVERLKKLAQKLCERIPCPEGETEKLQRAIHLSKADLITDMVKELDELQGYMGYVYALKQGEDEQVALAIYEQYKPKNVDDDPPKTFIGSVLSLVDKLDDLISFFSVGEIPKGSSDPYGLRRSAFGIFKILESRGWDIDIRDFFSIYKEVKNVDELEVFLSQRLESYLENYGYDIVRAVLAVISPLKPYSVIKRVKEISEMKNSKDFLDIYEAYRRVVRILPKGWESIYVEESLLKEPQERILWDRVRELEGKEELRLSELASLKKSIDDLFDNVLIMEKDEELRKNRLALLKRVQILFNRFADFSKVVAQEV